MFVVCLLTVFEYRAGSRAIPWHKLYGSCSGNEIYSVVLGDSRVFRTFAGKNFLFTSVMSRRKYDVCVCACVLLDLSISLVYFCST